MKKLLVLTAMLIGLSFWGFAQVNMPALLQLQEQLQADFEKEKAELRAWAKARKLPLRFTDQEGREVELMGVDETGMPIYYMTNNVVAAHSTSTSRVWTGGLLGYNLNGQGMTVGEWDGGATRLTHQELVGRAIQVDGATTLSNHATHVAGTLIAAGVQPNARGMAWQANLATHDWNNDTNEMNAAAQNGLLVSNHSYGQIAGWNNSNGSWYWYGNPAISPTLDWNFGFYNSKARDWDVVSRNNPFYLIVKSAGNNRNQGPNPGTTHFVRNASGTWVSSTDVRPRSGPYDCLPTYSVAKNILTVGAVNDLPNGWQSAAGVSMSSFSSWGPTDDGRIKPDIVGNGVGLYSSYSGSNTQYSSISGTSMSGPNVAGSLILLQQHYQEVRGQFMRSATLKALAIHTADEAGPDPGPDYMFGWGMMNTAKAVQLIDNSDGESLLEEHILENGNEITVHAFHPQAGTLKVSIAWTDPASTPPPASLNNRTPLLVNDLDLRLVHLPTGISYAPWILDPDNPSAAANRGDNIRDNVEQVYVENAPPGDYAIRISHKGNLQGGNAQHFGLVASGLVKGIQANFVADKPISCGPDSIQFTNLSGGASQFLWSFPGGTPSTDTSVNPRVFYANPGVYEVSLRVTGAQGSDSLTRFGFIRIGVGAPLPFFEDFESGEPTTRGWSIENPDSATSWELFTTGGTSPGNQSMRMNFYSYNAVGQRDRLTSPALSFIGMDSVRLSFQHAYRAYSANNSDSLIIKVSNDCGLSWNRVLSVGGPTLATLANSTSNFAPTLSSSWCGNGNNLACFDLDLSAYSGDSLVYVQFEAWNGYGNNLYIDNIQVVGSPNVAPIADFRSSASRICAGGQLQFFDQSNFLPNSYLWSFAGGTPASSTDANPVVSYATPGTYSVQLIVQNQIGNDTLLMPAAVVVDSIPSVSLAPLAAMCSTDGILNLTAGSPTGGYYAGNGVVGTDQFDPALAGAGLHDITYTFTGPNGCEATATQQIMVTNTPAPVFGLVLPQCVDNAAYTLVEGQPAGGTYSGPGIVGGSQFDPALAGVGTHLITYTINDNGCVGAATRSITVTDAPQASINSIPPVCTGQGTILLVGQPIAGLFSGPGVAFGVFNPTVAGPGIHTITYLVDVNGCSSTAQIQVEVGATPARPIISLQGGDLVSSAPDSNQWYRDGQLIAGATAMSYTPTQTGTYQVRQLAGNCPSQLSEGVEVSQVGVQSLADGGIQMYPNPSAGSLMLRWDAGSITARALQIRSALGQVVHRQQILEGESISLQLNHLQDGLYTVELIGTDRIFSGRLILHR
ncbi:MAG: S8 family serine peptidase [Bacteroidia bacterium]